MEAAIKSYRSKGFGLIPNFLSESVCERAVKQINKLMMSYQPSKEQLVMFQAGEDGLKYSDYFLHSADKVRYFAEKGAYKDGKLVVPKLQSINKIGHSLHEKNQLFKQITFQKQIAQICKQCDLRNPVVVQSMTIMKPPKVGGLVPIHQDSSFLYDEPETLIGFWIPFQDATVQNGCLWGLPGSHKGELYTKVQVDWNTNISHFRALAPKDYKSENFVPIEMKRGSLAFFSGRFLHKSEANLSSKSRYAYTWHLKQRDTKWAATNWLQRERFPDFQFNYKPSVLI